MSTPFLAAFLPDSSRNRGGMVTAWARMADLGYAPLTAEEYSPQASGECTRTRCATVHTGYAGSEHRIAVRCTLCDWTGGVYPSHMRPRSGKAPARHKGCPFSGARKAKERAARYAEVGRALPRWDTAAAVHAVPVDDEHQAVTEAATPGPTTAARSRRAAYRMHVDQAAARPAVEPTEAQRLEWARRGELSSRPARVELYVSPIMHTAALRFQDADGQTHVDSDVTAMPGTRHGSPMSDELTGAALDAVKKRGFRVVPGAYWQENGDRATLAIEPTPAYLAYVERRFGPDPEIPKVSGVTFERTQRGRWLATVSDGRTFALTWSPSPHGDTWTVWGGDTYSHLVRSSKRLEKALFVLRFPAHARTGA